MITGPLFFFTELSSGRMAALRQRAICVAAAMAAMTQSGEVVSRANISKLTGLNKKTVSLAFNDLRDAGLMPKRRPNIC